MLNQTGLKGALCAVLVCMCVRSGSDCVFLRKWTAFSFSSFRMRRPRLDLIFSSSCSGSVLGSSDWSSVSSSSCSLLLFHSISANVEQVNLQLV